MKVAENATVRVGGTIDLADCVMLNGVAANAVSYSKADGGDGCSLSGSIFSAGSTVPDEPVVVIVTVGAGGNDNYAFAYKDVKVTINKADITPAVTFGGWTYGETANEPSVSGNPGEGAVTYEYKAKDADDSVYTTTVPDQAGSYVVRVTVALRG